MSIITKLLGIDKRVNMALKAHVSPRIIQIGFERQVYAGTDTLTLFRKAYEESIIYYSVIDRIAEKFGHLPRYVYNRSKSKKLRQKGINENRADGALMELLLHPNDFQGQDQFFYLAGLSYKATGETIIWKNRGGVENGQVIEIYVLPPWMVSIVPDGTLFGIKEYRLTVGGKNIVLPFDDVIHWKKPTLGLDTATWEHLRGANPFLAQRATIAQSNSITDAQTAMFDNGGARGVLYKKDLADLSDEQNALLDSVIDRKINSGQKKNAVVQLQGEWGFLDMGGTSVDMQLIEAEEKLIEKICFALGFPPELYRSDSTFANKEQAFVFFITNTLMPMAASFDGELIRGLAKDFPEADFIATDFEELPEMQNLRLERAKTYASMYELTPNQKLELNGFEMSSIPGMDMVYIPSNLVPIDEISIGESIDGNIKDYEP